MSHLVYVVHISQRSFYCLLVCRLSMSLCRAYNQAMSRVYISLCRFGFYSILLYSVFPPTTSFLLASSPLAIVPAILALVPGKTMVGGKWERGGRREAAVTRAFCWRSILSVSSVYVHWDRTYSMTTRAAIVSTMGTARGTTQGSCRPLVARTPSDPSYLAVFCSWEMVAGGLNPTLLSAHFPYPGDRLT
jgi:hypothetical protein